MPVTLYISAKSQKIKLASITTRKNRYSQRKREMGNVIFMIGPIPGHILKFRSHSIVVVSVPKPRYTLAWLPGTGWGCF